MRCKTQFWWVFLGVLSVLSAVRAAPLPEVTPADFVVKNPAEEASDVVFVAVDVNVDESEYGHAEWVYHYRVLLRSDRGVERFSKVELPYRRGVSIQDVKVRTIKPDGGVQQVRPNEIFDREVLRTQDVRQRVKSFAPVGLEPGVIVDYRYREVRDSTSFLFSYSFQRSDPVRYSRYRLKPLSLPGTYFMARSFRAPDLNLKRGQDTFYNFELRDLPPLRVEPFQPPTIQTQPSVVLYFTSSTVETEPALFWKSSSRALHELAQARGKVTKEMRMLAESLVSPSDTIQEKLIKLHDYCRLNLINTESERGASASKPKSKGPTNPSAAEILKSRQGNGDELAVALLGLARSINLDARLARTNDRTFIFFQAAMAEPFVFKDLVVGVKEGDTWTFCDPGAEYLPAGMLDWRHTGTSVLVGDPAQALHVPMPVMVSKETTRNVKGTFTLGEDGVLEGEVVVTRTGYSAAAGKRQYADASAQTRSDMIAAEVKRFLPGAEVSKAVIRNAEDARLPLELTFHLRVPDYAERTGNRLFFQPSVFRKGIRSPFPEEARLSAIVFPYLYQEIDEVIIHLPKGFVVESPHAPAGLNFGAAGDYQVDLRYGEKAGLLVLKRSLTWDLFMAPAKSYPDVKKILDAVTTRDGHLLTLKRSASPEPERLGEVTAKSSTE